jgi:phosphatidylserine decarboxylase
VLTRYGLREWLVILVVGLAAAAGFILLHWWWALAAAVLIVLAGLSFFRDPTRTIPADPGLYVSPADGLISSVHHVEHFAPFGEPATCIRVFLSVLDVHVNRSPCNGQVASIAHKPGEHLNVLNPRSAEVNESTLMVLVDPATQRPVAAVRQVAGLIARRIVCAAQIGQKLRRGERYGMIKFGSTTELFIPASSQPQIDVVKGQRVYGGRTILARVAAGNKEV